MLPAVPVLTPPVPGLPVAVAPSPVLGVSGVAGGGVGELPGRGVDGVESIGALPGAVTDAPGVGSVVGTGGVGVPGNVGDVGSAEGTGVVGTVVLPPVDRGATVPVAVPDALPVTLPCASKLGRRAVRSVSLLIAASDKSRIWPLRVTCKARSPRACASAVEKALIPVTGCPPSVVITSPARKPA